MAVVTIVGATGSSINVTVNGASTGYRPDGRTNMDARIAGFQETLHDANDSKKLAFLEMAPNQVTTGVHGNMPLEGVATVGGSYSINGTMDYVVVGRVSSAEEDQVPLTDRVVIDTTGMNSSTTVVGGSTDGIDFIGGNKGGNITFGAGNNTVALTNGDYDIMTADGNDTITTGNANTTINAGGGYNKITLGAGTNTVNSYGQDTITATEGNQQVILRGAGSNVVSLGDYSFVQTMTYEGKDTITVGFQSIVNGDGQGGGKGSVINFTGGSATASLLQNTTINAAADLTVGHGSNNNINVMGDLTFLNDSGNDTVSAFGNSTIFGSGGLNLVYNANGGNVNNNKFVANGGRETVDGSGSQNGFWGWGFNKSPSAAESIIGGQFSDHLVGGSGNTTLTGGSGAANEFMIINGDGRIGGHTTITDFDAASGNYVTLLGYNYSEAQIQSLVDNQQTDAAGNSTITLDDSTKITFLNHTAKVSDFHS